MNHCPLKWKYRYIKGKQKRELKANLFSFQSGFTKKKLIYAVFKSKLFKLFNTNFCTLKCLKELL